MADSRLVEKRKRQVKQKDNISKLPNELLQNISYHLNNQDFKSLAIVSKRLGQQFFQPLANEDWLFSFIIDGDEAAVKRLLNRDAKLMISSLSGIHPRTNRRVLHISPLQLVLQEGDIQMCSLMLRVIKQNMDIFTPKQLANFLAQIQEKNNKQTVVFDFSKIANVISDADVVEVKKQLKVSKCQLTKHFYEFQIEFELHITNYNSDIQNLIAGHSMLDQHPDWNEYQKKLFWRQVIGHVQAKMSACDLQALVQTLHNYNFKRVNDRLSIKKIFSLSLDSTTHHLGEHFALSEMLGNDTFMPLVFFAKCMDIAPEDYYMYGESRITKLQQYADIKSKSMQKAIEYLQDTIAPRKENKCVIS